MMLCFNLVKLTRIFFVAGVFCGSVTAAYANELRQVYDSEDTKTVYNPSERYSYKTPPWALLELGYTFGEGIGIHSNYVTAATFITPQVGLPCFQPFLDLRGHYIKDREWAGNFGLGGRWVDNELDFIVGGNVYYDYRKTRQTHFNQIGFGLEFFVKCLEFRLNTYFPVGNTHHTTRNVYDDYIGDFVFICCEKDSAQKGVDAEVGGVLWRWGCWDLWGGIGGYYFKDACGHKERWGEKARLALGLGTFVNFEARVYHDQIQNTFYQGVVTLAIPFNACFCADFWDNCAGLLYQPVERNDMIVRRTSCCWKF